MAKKKPSEASSEINLVRRHKEKGTIEPRPRGRQNPEYEYGYISGTDESTFAAGDPPKRRGRKRRGRPAGSRNRAPRQSGGNGRSTAGLSEIERIVAREVESRLKQAKAAALTAFERALGV